MIQRFIKWIKSFWQPDTKMEVEYTDYDGQPIGRATLSSELLEKIRERNTTDPY